MSSVLRALKKIEQENSSAAGMPGKTRSGLYSSPVWQQMVLGGLVVALLILSVMIVMLVRGPNPVPDDRSEPAATLYRPNDSGPSVPAASAGAEEAPKHPVSAPSVENRSRQTAKAVDPPGQLSDIPAPIGFKEDHVHAPQHDAPDQHAADISAGTAESGAPFRIINQDKVLSMETGASFSSSPDMTQARPPDDFPLLDPAAGLTLQAISWSIDPARRLAVINGRICREGEPVDGYALVRINPDDVLLSDGRISGKLVFKIR